MNFPPQSDIVVKMEFSIVNRLTPLVAFSLFLRRCYHFVKQVMMFRTSQIIWSNSGWDVDKEMNVLFQTLFFNAILQSTVEFKHMSYVNLKTSNKGKRRMSPPPCILLFEESGGSIEHIPLSYRSAYIYAHMRLWGAYVEHTDKHITSPNLGLSGF